MTRIAVHHQADDAGDGDVIAEIVWALEHPETQKPRTPRPGYTLRRTLTGRNQFTEILDFWDPSAPGFEAGPIPRLEFTS